MENQIVFASDLLQIESFLVSFLIALFPIDKVLYPLLLDLGN